MVVDRATARGDLATAVRASVAAGVDVVQVRARELEGAALLAHTDEVAAAAREGARRSGRALRVVVNRRTDVALAAGADGVHLGFDGVEPRDARALLGGDAWIGVSLHDPGEAAAVRGASYAHLAPIFAPLSKASGRPPLGLAALSAATGTLPVLAQGGIDAGNAGNAVAAGAAGVAVTGAILGADDPAAAAAALRAALDAARRTRA